MTAIADLFTQKVEISPDTAVSLMQELGREKVYNSSETKPKIEEAIQQLGDIVKES